MDFQGYETRRARRLRLERERRARRRSSAKWGGAAAAVVLIIAAAALINGAIQSSVQRQAEAAAKLAAQTKIENSPGYKIQRDLPAKINELNQQLGLPVKVGSGDLPGKNDVAVTLVDLSGKERGNVDYNGDVQFTSASTYKLYVAYAMVSAVEAGQLRWTSALNGTTVDDCFARMIVRSDNACPEAYIGQIGYAKLNAAAAALGVSDKTQFAYDNMRTSSNDLALLLQKLYAGDLMSDANREKLLNLMEEQIYRDGIPAGVADDAVVADKVGFLDALLGDAAIVYADTGDYVLVIMTNGESWQFIAQLTSWIDGQMRQ